MKHIEVDMLSDSGSQVNLVYEEVVKKLDLSTIPLENPYRLGWVTNDAHFQVTNIMNTKFCNF